LKPSRGWADFAPRDILRRKEELALELDADWLMHVDADQIRLPPDAEVSLAEAFEHVERRGENAVSFFEFTFIPTREEPDRDHAHFRQTMRSYYPFCPSWPHRLNAWKRQNVRVDLASSGGHAVAFPGLRMSGLPFPMKHYLFLSVPHALEKYGGRVYDPEEVAKGWHGWRAHAGPKTFILPHQGELRRYRGDNDWKWENPRTRHYVAM
jgi:hypothetical protein